MRDFSKDEFVFGTEDDQGEEEEEEKEEVFLPAFSNMSTLGLDLIRYSI